MSSEAEYTAPRADCPHPEYWHAPDAYAAEAEVTALVAAMVRALQPELAIETGTHNGDTAKAIGQALAANGHGRLVSLESDPAHAARARVLCESLPVTVVEADSRNYVPDEPIDFVWFDSSFIARIGEYQQFRRHFSPRAVVMFHDTGPHYPLAAALRMIPGLNLIFLPTPRGIAIATPR